MKNGTNFSNTINAQTLGIIKQSFQREIFPQIGKSSPHNYGKIVFNTLKKYIEDFNGDADAFEAFCEKLELVLANIWLPDDFTAEEAVVEYLQDRILTYPCPKNMYDSTWYVIHVILGEISHQNNQALAA